MSWTLGIVLKQPPFTSNTRHHACEDCISVMATILWLCKAAWLINVACVVHVESFKFAALCAARARCTPYAHAYIIFLFPFAFLHMSACAVLFIFLPTQQVRSIADREWRCRSVGVWPGSDWQAINSCDIDRAVSSKKPWGSFSLQ